MLNVRKTAAEERETPQATMEEIEKLRKIQLDATIVRIMKARKTIEY